MSAEPVGILLSEVHCARCGQDLPEDRAGWKLTSTTDLSVIAVCPSCQTPAERADVARLTVEGNVEELVEHGCTDEALRTAMSRVSRNALPELLFDLHWRDVLTADLAAWAVPHAWKWAEWPLQALDAETWRDLFDLAGYTVNGKPAPRPGEPLRLYRGADAEHRAGWSWTDDLATAAWFAHRSIWPAPGRVWTTLVEPDQLLARIYDEDGGRGEHEYVVDPEDMRGDVALDVEAYGGDDPAVAARMQRLADAEQQRRQTRQRVWLEQHRPSSGPPPGAH